MTKSDLYPTIDQGYTKYGAQLGRGAWFEEPQGPVTLYHLPVSAHGYDPQGAYWGTPDNLYLLTDGEVFRVFVRAASAESAIEEARKASGYQGDIQIDRLGMLLGGYVRAMLWTEHYTDEEGLEQHFYDAGHDIGGLSEEALARLKKDCEAFLEKAGPLIPKDADYDDVGHDFWLTGQGHGTGFWDSPSRWGGEDNAQALTDLARECCSVEDVYLLGDVIEVQ